MIYRAKHVLPISSDPLEDGEVVVSDGRIKAVGTGLAEEYPGEAVDDLGNVALLPGFVNAHSHVALSFKRGRLDGLNLWDWMGALGFGPGAVVDEELVRVSAVVGAAECALSGVTCIGDCWPTSAGADAMGALGMRGIAYLEVFGQSAGDAYAARFDRAVRNVRDLQGRVDSRIRIGISPHSIYTSNREMLRLASKSYAELGVPIAIHLAETEAETDYSLSGAGPVAEGRRRLGYEPMVSGLTPTGVLREAGLLMEGVCLAHCVHLSDDEVDVVATSGAGIAHCARSNAYLGAGIAPLPRMLAEGANVGIGTDSSASCMKLDFFEEMRFALGVHRASAKDARVVLANDILRLATCGGAAALGLDSEIGTLEAGKRADMLSVSLENALPGEDVVLSVLSSSPADVKLVLVDGEELARDGRPVKLDLDACEQALRERMGRQGIG